MKPADYDPAFALSRELARMADEAGVTRAELARRTGMAWSTVANKLSGHPRKMRVDEARVLANALGERLSDVMYRAEAAAS
ncbi:helix-turn-helix domain-containing protein [Demequina sp. NBRC 110053]|uniref:helix-turn-helix domain-containing protein n=1 Tax=Demequina sp. NBRC 110053 TaxID=1570342 RepID=UPI000A018834|nr:helix-turn-helix transcriptional regulator [Demequina sp. NBRC 110053]